MIKEAYCSFETSKLLREKGFDEPCEYKYVAESDCREPKLVKSPIGKGSRYLYDAPTHQMAMAWLREGHNIFIEIGTSWNSENIWYFSTVVTYDDEKDCWCSDDMKSYDETVEVALKHCLEHYL